MRFVLSFFATVTPAIADPGSYGPMAGWGYGHGFGMMFGPVLWLIVLGLVISGVIWLVRRLDADNPTQRRSDALAELDMRFARGEIDAEEYSARKKLLIS